MASVVRQRYLRVCLSALLLLTVLAVPAVSSPPTAQAAPRCWVNSIGSPYWVGNPGRFRVYADAKCSPSVYYLHIKIEMWATTPTRPDVYITGGGYTCTNCSIVGGAITKFCETGQAGELYGRARVSFKRTSGSSLETSLWAVGPKRFVACESP